MVCGRLYEEVSSAQGMRSRGQWSGNRDGTAEQVEKATKKGAMVDQLEPHCPTWCLLIVPECVTHGWSTLRGAIRLDIGF